MQTFNLFNKSEAINDKSKNDSNKIFYYAQSGFTQAGLNKGKIQSLRIHLSKIYTGYIEKNKNLEHLTIENDRERERERTKFESEISIIKQENKDLKTIKLNDYESKILSLKEEINSIREDPESIHIEKIDKFGYFLGLFIWIFLTIYLWIFYSSATYSAFFREIDFTKNVVMNSIFYANSLSESLEMGLSALILTLVSPFIFLAMGYLIHKFFETKKYIDYLKITTLIFLTFVFDCILAYEITKKIYEAISLNKLTEMPPYSLETAIGDVNFWLIIFAGFVVYIVWGLVLSFVAEGFKNFDRVKAAIKKRQENIRELNSKIQETKTKITNNNLIISQKEGEIKKVEQSMGKTPFNRKEFEKIIDEFMSGWLQYLVGRKAPQDELQEAEDVKESFLNRIIEGT